jgi:FixJ family two-component response regulator
MPGSDRQWVLVFDRDEIVRDSIKTLLESHGYSVGDFSTPEKLLDAIKPANADCLVLGLNGNLVDGLDVLSAMRRRGISLPAIFLVGGDTAGMRRTAMRAGAFAHLQRPAPEAALLQAIRDAMAYGTVGDARGPRPSEMPATEA